MRTIAYGPVGCRPVGTQEIAREFIDLAGGFTQVVTVSDQGVKTIYVSGQVGQGDGLAEQSRSVLAAVARRLEAAGATPADLVKLNIYMADYSPEDAAVLAAAQRNGFPDETLPATTLIGVESPYSDTALIEIEGVAVVPGR